MSDKELMDKLIDEFKSAASHDEKFVETIEHVNNQFDPASEISLAKWRELQNEIKNYQQAQAKIHVMLKSLLLVGP